MKTSVVLTTVLLLFGVYSAFAATPDAYRKRIDEARMDVMALKGVDDQGRGKEGLRKKINEIQHLIPRTEHLEWQGGSVETDNQWLHDDLAAYLQEKDADARSTALLGIDERLFAIGERIDELEKTTSAERSKDDDKQQLAEILRREEYQKPKAADESLFQKWWYRFWRWLEDFFPKPSIAPQTDNSFGSLQFVLQMLIYAAVIVAMGFLLYRFFPYFADRFGLKKKIKKRDRVILGERILDDESADDLFGEAERLAGDGQLREAIRKGYIALLCELNDRKIIGLARHKTNRDYLRDVRKRAGLFENMSGLTGAYERNWYGLRPSEMNDWEDFRSKYKQTIVSANG